ncbi:AMP-binding protein [Pseudoalteromonas luteoviolacea]|uniref:AMP-dependent synthetase/ligase domain-containing protein n=1 Tax=Pseudoalteromonas luteoviolacea S4054 TaxID=1129367 RepID=A0A0F6A996_9GAMM|nr:AMP-binding protein [Pseudoalteromonas luteoviolacea]AOT07456.1 hypothetical protein S4054249_06205 [Pseudoalteromonas luteoviolacea]AOT12372.1 hypothetical protein S40542_06205 [Pseudoalteromonas luteoviolacea]AOT17285.1 hypothetical protein S4054_06205 [Pseudoalteromonas luteoviolacea]KKE81969.1 hypothetical protein N479_20340 [Pseudoalteromonas luteoviolacea S4054]KZN74163.1 hypothetical protein N481_09285 [Pseudoalteromonas luteoviolacea S4047-1]
MNIVKELLKAPRSNNALYVGGKHYSYDSLQHIASSIMIQLQDDTGPIGILCYRDISYYALVYGCAMSERTFVPLGVKFPINRLISVIEQSGIRQIAYSESYQHIATELKEALPNVTFYCADSPTQTANLSLPLSDIIGNHPAYILFTSGSTGQPKGVPISYANLNSYLGYMINYLGLDETDKVSQLFDPTFDLSIHDIFVTWLSGACLYVLPEEAMIAPGKFVKKHDLTVWFSVPSTAAIMGKLGMLKPDSYPSLKFSLFCGEPLPIALATQFQQAASNSTVINLYGPTEATIACSLHVFNAKRSYAHCYTPIGKPFPHMHFSLTDQNELLISGPQVFSGYINNVEKTNSCLVKINNKSCYHSGDIVKYNKMDELEYVSRSDDQVKIQGYRIELSEIDTLAKSILSNPLVQSVATPRGAPQSITLFICGNADKELEQIAIKKLKAKVPAYMVPKNIYWLDSMPLNSNGKIDKLALYAMLEKK